MKIFENKSIFKKVLIIFIIVLIASFCFSGKVQASDEGVGGKLLKPIVDLLLSLGDGVYNLAHKAIIHQEETLIHIDLTTGFVETLLTVLVFALVAVAIGALIVFTAGLAAPVLAALGLTVGVGTVVFASVAAGTVAAVVFNSNAFPDDDLYLPVYTISPEEIFSNEFLMFDVNFFSPQRDKILRDQNDQIVYDRNHDPIKLESTAGKLKNTIANWYVILRDISVVALLSVLVYVGIRILISTTSNDKAKYKQMLMDWIVAICLLFVMQYIMSFSNILVGKVTELLSGATQQGNTNLSVITDKDGKVTEGLIAYGYDEQQIEQMYVKDGGSNVINDEGDKSIYWETNLIGMTRLYAQMAQKESATYAGYTIMFLVLVFFTLFFIVTYLKRVLYMAFLTLIAPLVALTYPIDKINDGKAQAFNMWFKEYIFNLLIQPLHLLLYTILVTSAFELASSNIIYALVAIGFMIPAEKLLRKFFGFEKAQTPGMLAGAAGAAMTMTAMNKLLSKGPKGGGKSGGNGSNSSKEGGGNERPPRINSDFDKQENMLGSGNYEKDENDTNKDNSQNYNNIENNENDSYEDYIDELRNRDNYADSQNHIEDPSIEDPNYMYMHPEEYDDDGNYIGAGQSNNQNQEQIVDGDDNQGNESQDTADIIPYSNEQAQNQTTSNSTNSNEDSRRELKKPTARERLGMYSRYYAKGLANKAANRIKKSHPVRTATRALGGAAVGAVAGGIGLAAGIASGDLSKSVQYGGGAALGGYKLGSGGTSSFMNAIHVDGMDEIQERSKYRTEEEYRKAKQEEYKKKYKQNIENQFKLEQKYGREKANKIMDTVVPDCLEEGIYNIDDIIAINEMVDSKAVENLKMGISTAKYASMMGDTTKMKAKDRKEWHTTVSNGFAKNKRVTDENLDTDKIATDVMNRVDAFNKIKTKL